MQEGIERKRLLAMDEAFCASMIAAQKQGKKKNQTGSNCHPSCLEVALRNDT
jgi:hypothetical protein